MSKVSDLFYIYTGSKLDYGKQIEDSEGINFVSRNSNNNGVVGKVALTSDMKIYEKGDITVPLGGSFLLSAFVQDERFVTAQNVHVLRAKNSKMKECEKWFYCHALRMNRFKFCAFGREVNKYLANIELPNIIPDWVYDANLFKIETKNVSYNKPIDTSDWIEFYVCSNEHKGLFRIENCKCNVANDLEDGFDIDYIGAKKKQNGFMKRVAYDESKITRGNCIIFICDGQGSVGFTNYTADNFIGSTTLSAGYNDKLNKYIGMFIVTILDRERYKYCYGRKYRNTINQIKIKLPAKKDKDGRYVITENPYNDNGYEPDWNYMERYIKKLPFADKL